MKVDVIVIGAGAAGMMSAHTASLMGKKVLLLERGNSLGRKILVTGKGRCNITNACDVITLLEHVKTNSQFLYSSFSRFNAQDTISYFETSGLAVKTERGNRVFPSCDRAIMVRNTLEKNLREAGTLVVHHARVIELLFEKKQIIGARCENDKTYFANSVIIATGGKSYPRTGSTGDGYQLAQQVGHHIIALKPSLIPIKVLEKWRCELVGLSLKNVQLSLYKGISKKPVFSQLGEMLFTHHGLSGPLVLSASAHLTNEINQEIFRLSLDLKPALSDLQLDKRLVRLFSIMPNREFSNSLQDLLPRKMIPVILSLSTIVSTQKNHTIQKQQRQHLVKLLKNLTLTVTGVESIEQAIVTSGGVDVSQINPKTMESKLISGLFFAGEVLDVDGYTGGYNLQIAFSTGYTAGLHC